MKPLLCALAATFLLAAAPAAESAPAASAIYLPDAAPAQIQTVQYYSHYHPHYVRRPYRRPYYHRPIVRRHFHRPIRRYNVPVAPFTRY